MAVRENGPNKGTAEFSLTLLSVYIILMRSGERAVTRDPSLFVVRHNLSIRSDWHVFVLLLGACLIAELIFYFHGGVLEVLVV